MQRWMLAGVGVAVAVVVIVVLVSTTGDGDTAPGPTVAASTTTVTAPAETTAAAAPDSAQAPVTTASGLDSSATCERVEAEYVIADGWFANFTDHRVPDGGEIVGDTFYMGNVLQLRFPVDGGEMYIYGTALFTNDAGEIRSYFVVRDSRRESVPEGSPLLYDSTGRSIQGEVPVSASLTVAGETTPQETKETAAVTATYDEAAGTVTGTIAFSELTLELDATAARETIEVFTTPECWATIAEQDLGN